MDNGINKTIRIYVSHPIRGKKGDKATPEDMRKNINHILRQTNELEAYLLDWQRMDGFPKIELYIPGAHDEFVQIAYDCDYINIDQILDVDCRIIDRCSLVLAVGYPISSGMKHEIKHAIEHGIPLFTCRQLSKVIINDFKKVLKVYTAGG